MAGAIRAGLIDATAVVVLPAVACCRIYVLPIHPDGGRSEEALTFDVSLRHEDLRDLDAIPVFARYPTRQIDRGLPVRAPLEMDIADRLRVRGRPEAPRSPVLLRDLPTVPQGYRDELLRGIVRAVQPTRNGEVRTSLPAVLEMSTYSPAASSTASSSRDPGLSS